MKFNTAIDKEKTRVITANYDLGTNLDELTILIGAETIFNAAVDSIVISIQAGIRRMMRAGKSDDEITAWVTTFVPGVRGPRVAAQKMTLAEALNQYITGSSEKRDEMEKNLDETTVAMLHKLVGKK